MEMEGREISRVDRRDQRLLLARRDERVGLGQPGKAGFTKQIRLDSDAVHSSGAVVTPPTSRSMAGDQDRFCKHLARWLTTIIGPDPPGAVEHGLVEQPAD
jgi:hypothetical protein